MNKKFVALVSAVTFILSTFLFLQFMEKGIISTIKLQQEDIGKICVSQVYPAMMEADRAQTPVETEKNKNNSAVTPTETKNKTQVTTPIKSAKNKGKADNSKPQVIIYHTHGSESYQPYSKSNFHTTKEEGSVREVGTVLAKELESLGVSVVHDKTIHDRTSFNQSYDRSLKTITALQKKYPSAKYIIDLHRDAAAYSGNVGKTIKIDGEKVAKFSLVVGKNNDNFSKLLSFARNINSKANVLYPGFGGSVIEKTYRYNEYVADNYILLEVGNNQNDIKEVKATGKYFAHVMEKVIND